jgi:NADH-quinone oxidoreductase subunit C
MTTDETQDTDDAETDDTETNDAPSPETAFGCLVSYSRGQKVLHTPKDEWFSVAEALLADGYRMCIDLTAVDYLTYKGHRSLPEGITPERFEVVAIFANFTTRDRLRVRTQVSVDEPTIDSLYVLYPGSDFMEREVFDMFGLSFHRHPDLSRILMPESWEGHPLRKDYAIGSIPVQFKGTETSNSTGGGGGS